VLTGVLRQKEITTPSERGKLAGSDNKEVGVKHKMFFAIAGEGGRTSAS